VRSAAVAPPQDRQLVAQHEDLNLFRAVAAREQQDEREHSADDDVDESDEHRRPSEDESADANAPSAGRPSRWRRAPAIEFVHPTPYFRRRAGIVFVRREPVEHADTSRRDHMHVRRSVHATQHGLPKRARWHAVEQDKQKVPLPYHNPVVPRLPATETAIQTGLEAHVTRL
jgi:hypothetical protein